MLWESGAHWNLLFQLVSFDAAPQGKHHSASLHQVVVEFRFLLGLYWEKGRSFLLLLAGSRSSGFPVGLHQHHPVWEIWMSYYYSPHRGRGMLASSHWTAVKVLPLLWGSLTPPLWGEWGLPCYCRMGLEIPAPHSAFSNTALLGVWVTSLQPGEGGSQGSTLSLGWWVGPLVFVFILFFSLWHLAGVEQSFSNLHFPVSFLVLCLEKAEFWGGFLFLCVVGCAWLAASLDTSLRYLR